jgi:hypothetical protein
MIRELRSAADFAPQVVEVTTSEAVRVRVQRPTRMYVAPVSVRVSRRLVTGARETVCEATRRNLGANHFELALTKGLDKQGLSELTIEVWDHGSGGPTGDSPYTVQLTVESTFIRAGDPGAARTSRQNYVAAPRKPASLDEPCEEVRGPKRPLAKLELVSARQVTLTRGGQIQLLYLEAGRNVYVELSHRSRPARAPLKVQIRMASKAGADGPFTYGCESDVELTEGPRPL